MKTQTEVQNQLDRIKSISHMLLDSDELVTCGQLGALLWASGKGGWADCHKQAAELWDTGRKERKALLSMPGEQS